MQPHRTVDEAPAPQPASVRARHSAGGAAAFGASSHGPSRQQPSRDRATTQGRHRGARQRVPERAPAEHDRRPRQGAQRRSGQGRRSAVAHRERRRDREGPQRQMTSAQTLRNPVMSEARGSDRARGPTITARLDDGPLQGIRIEAEVVEGRRARSMSLPTTAARAATASRSGPRAVRLRPTRSCTACSPSLDCRSPPRLGKLALANGRRAPHQRRRHRPPGPSSPCLRRLTKRRASRARYGRHRSLGPRFRLAAVIGGRLAGHAQ